MIIRITLFVTVLIYALIAGRGFFCILILHRMAKKMEILAWQKTKKQLEDNVESKHMSSYYVALTASVLLTTFTVVNPNGILFIGSVIALAGLITDIVLALYGNSMINRIARKRLAAGYPANWKQVRSRWVFIFYTRHVVNMAGFLSLVVGTVFGL